MRPARPALEGPKRTPRRRLLEAKAGVDPLAVKREPGDRLLLCVYVRYIFATDHSTPSNVSLEAFRRITDVVKDVGRY